MATTCPFNLFDLKMLLHPLFRSHSIFLGKQFCPIWSIFVMNRGNFQKPTVEIPSPDKTEDVDIDLFNLSTTTWQQLADYNIQNDEDTFGEFAKLSPLHQAR